MTRNSIRKALATGTMTLLLAAAPQAANAALLELEVTGITNGAWAGFPDTVVTQTAVYDTDAAPATSVIANVAVATYPLVSYSLTFGATTMTPTADWGGNYPTPKMIVTDTTAGGPFGNPDAFSLGARLNENYAGFTMKGTLLYSFDYSFSAINSTAAPTALAWFSQFANSNVVQIDFSDAAGGNYSMGLRDQVVTLTEVPEPGTLALLTLSLLAARRNR